MKSQFVIDPQQWKLFCLTSELMHNLILNDLENADGQNNCQSKFGESNILDHLTQQLQASLTYLHRSNLSLTSTEITATITTSIDIDEYSLSCFYPLPLKALGSLCRIHDINKERLTQTAVLTQLTSFLSSLYTLITASSTNILWKYEANFGESLCWCLGNISYPSTTLQDALGQAHAIPLLLYVLQELLPHKHVVYEGCRALRNLCYDHTSNLSIAITSNAIDLFAMIFEKYESDEALLQWIMYSLATLVTCELSFPQLHAKNLISKIVIVLQQFVKEADIVQWTALVISNLGLYTEMAECLVQMNCCESLVNVSVLFYYFTTLLLYYTVLLILYDV
jgi:hypothetical protein